MGSIAGAPRVLTLTLLGATVVGALAAYTSGNVNWSLSLACAALASLGWAAAGAWRSVRKGSVIAWAVGIASIAWLLAPAGMERWGGLLMSVLFTLLASVLSVPLGVALAFGRRSRYPSARLLCSAYIEIMRSLPLILVCLLYTSDAADE